MPAPILPPASEDEEQNAPKGRSPLGRPRVQQGNAVSYAKPIGKGAPAGAAGNPMSYAKPITASQSSAASSQAVPSSQSSPMRGRSQRDPVEAALTAPTPYEPNAARLAKLENRAAADSQPVNPNSAAVKPKWEDRLAAGMVGFGAGFDEGPSRGIKAGSSFLNRRFNNAEAARQQNMQRDQAALRNFDAQERMGAQRFRDQSIAYEDALRGDEQRSRQKQNAWNRQFRTQEAKSSAANTQWEHNFDQQKSAQAQERFNQEQQRMHQEENTQNALRRDEIALEGERERYEQNRERGGSGLSAADQVRLREQAVKLDQKRQAAYQALENGDPAKGVEGYREQLKGIQTDTSLSKQAKDAQIAQLNAEHVRRKNAIERTYAADMNALGYHVQPVVYNANDQAENTQPAQNAPREKQPTPEAVTTADTHQRVQVGQTVRVGTRLAKITGVNPKTGRPIVSYINGGE